MHPSACGVCLLSAPGSASTRSQDLSPSKLATDNSSDICLSNIVTLGVVGRRKQPSHFQISQLKESELEGGRGGRQLMSSHRATQQLVQNSGNQEPIKWSLKSAICQVYLYGISGSRNRLIRRDREKIRMATHLGDGASRQPTVKINIEHFVPETRQEHWMGICEGDFPKNTFSSILILSQHKGQRSKEDVLTGSWFTSESNFPGRFCSSTRSPELEVGEEGELYLIEKHQPPFSENFVLTN